MDGRKRSGKGKALKSSTGTDNNLHIPADLNSDSDDEQSIPKTSKQFKHDNVIPSWIESNHELLKQNPFLIPNVLACLCENSSSQALFKYRLVGQHIWNELAVNGINQDRSEYVRLFKIFDPSRTDGKSIPGTRATVLIDIRELISTLVGGGLKKSILTRIYLNSSLTHEDLNKFLQLSGQNIRSLHYDRDSLKDLRQMLQICAKNLKSLSLWRSWDENDNEEFTSFKFPCLESLVIVSGELGPYMRGNDPVQNNICIPSKEFLTHIFQASPNFKSLSARFYDSSILDSGLSFKHLTTLCIKFKISIAQLRALCHVGLRLKKLRLQRLFIASNQDHEHVYFYNRDPEWMEFRLVLLEFIQTQANTLEYFGVYLYMEQFEHLQISFHVHDSPYEQWSSTTGFPRMPNLHTLILYECSGKISREEFGYLFPKLRNLEIVECEEVLRPETPDIMEYPMQIPFSQNPSMFVQNIRGIKPTVELAQIFPSVIELHIVSEFPHELPIYWPKLKHLYYKDYCDDDRLSVVLADIRQINEFLVGISPEESERIEEQGKRFGIDELAKLELPRSRPSIFDLNELETFDFGFLCYEFEQSSNFESPGIESALGVLITLGLSRLTHLKKLNFELQQKPRPRGSFHLPQKSLDGLVNTFSNRNYLNISTDCNKYGREKEFIQSISKKWTMGLNVDHHKSEWKEIDGLFRDDPDIYELGLPAWIDEDYDENGYFFPI